MLGELVLRSRSASKPCTKVRISSVAMSAAVMPSGWPRRPVTFRSEMPWTPDHSTRAEAWPRATRRSSGSVCAACSARAAVSMPCRVPMLTRRGSRRRLRRGCRACPGSSPCARRWCGRRPWRRPAPGRSPARPIPPRQSVRRVSVPNDVASSLLSRRRNRIQTACKIPAVASAQCVDNHRLKYEFAVKSLRELDFCSSNDHNRRRNSRRPTAPLDTSEHQRNHERRNQVR